TPRSLRARPPLLRHWAISFRPALHRNKSSHFAQCKSAVALANFVLQNLAAIFPTAAFRPPTNAAVENLPGLGASFAMNEPPEELLSSILHPPSSEVCPLSSILDSLSSLLHFILPAAPRSAILRRMPPPIPPYPNSELDETFSSNSR